MKTVHTIQLNNGTGTRTSTSRVYGACVVSTVTQTTVDMEEARLAALKAQVVELGLQVANLTATLGMTVAEAEKLHSARIEEYFRVVHRIEQGLRSRLSPLTEADRQKARQIAASQGYPDPYKMLESILLDKARELELAQRAISAYVTPAVGDQCVVAWSRDAHLALKVKDQYQKNARNGYTYTVRTDIQTKTS